MREFFKQVILNLYSYCGNRQAEKMTDDELRLLLDVLDRVSKVYSYIPEEKQKEIIESQLIKDKEYQNINARLISKWLEENGKQYFSQECHRPIEPQAEPLTGEARDAAIKKYLETLAGVQDNFQVKPISNAEIMREKFMGKEAKPITYKPISDEAVNKKELHKQYVKENYDPITGNCLETWIPENEWLKKNYPASVNNDL